jgi:hypothetical protein
MYPFLVNANVSLHKTCNTTLQHLEMDKRHLTKWYTCCMKGSKTQKPTINSIGMSSTRQVAAPDNPQHFKVKFYHG